MADHENHRIASSLASRVAAGADAEQIAEVVVATFQQIGAALTPIVGPRGVAALYMRSVHLAGSAHPWLAGAQDGPSTAIDVAQLRSLLEQQRGADAAAGGGDLLQTFRDLLASLVGASLTDRLLRSVWAHPVSGPPAQDTSP